MERTPETLTRTSCSASRFRASVLEPLTDRFQRSNELGIYFDDTWKFSPRLTLNLGLRWDRFGATKFDDGLMFNWDSQTGEVVVPRAAMSRISPLYPLDQIRIRPGEVVPSPDNRNLAPRLGMAYRLNDKTVLRGGYGIYNEFLGQFRFDKDTGGPFQLTETFNNVIVNGLPLVTISAGLSGHRRGRGCLPKRGGLSARRPERLPSAVQPHDRAPAGRYRSSCHLRRGHAA